MLPGPRGAVSAPCALRLPLLPTTTFTFFGASSTSQETTLIKYVPTWGFASGVLELRCLARSFPSVQEISLILRPVSVAEDDPSVLYAVSGADVTATVTRVAPDVPGALLAPLPSPVAAFYTLLVRALQDPSPSSMSATLSASLTLRSW